MEVPGGAKPGDSATPPRVTHESDMGIGAGTMQDMFSLHNHAGGPASGGTLYGPYFIRDPLGRPWKLVVDTAGGLSTVRAF